MTALGNNNFWYCGSTKWTAVTAWPTSTAVSAGALYRQNATPTVGNERVFAVIVAGTTNSTEPTWVVTKGAKTTDNTVTWMEVTGQPGVNGDITNSPVWGASLTTSLGQIIYDSISGALQVVTTAGTTTGTKPTFSATAGTTTTDNTTTWTSLGAHGNFGAFAAPFARMTSAFASTWMAAADTLYVSNNHAATQSSALTYTFPGTAGAPTKIICVTDTAAPPTAASTTATESTTGASSLTFGSGFAYGYGVTFQAGSSSSTASILLNNNTGGTLGLYLDTCGLTLNNTASGSVIDLGAISTVAAANYVDLKNCAFVFGAAGQHIVVGAGLNKITGGTLAATGTVPNSAFVIPSSNAAGQGDAFVRDLNASNLTGTLLSTNGGPSSCGINVTASNIVVGSGCTLTTVFYNGPGSGVQRAHNVDSGNTNYRYLYQTYLGTVQSETSIVRTGGATDGTTPLSWKVISSANTAPHQPLVTEEIAKWNSLTSGSHTATLYITTSTALTNANCWMELEYLGSSSTPQGSYVNSQVALLGTATALSTDTSTWGGTAQTYVYKVSVTFSPLKAGPVKATLSLALASTTLWVDPLLLIV